MPPRVDVVSPAAMFEAMIPSSGIPAAGVDMETKKTEIAQCFTMLSDPRTARFNALCKFEGPIGACTAPGCDKYLASTPEEREKMDEPWIGLRTNVRSKLTGQPQAYSGTSFGQLLLGAFLSCCLQSPRVFVLIMTYFCLLCFSSGMHGWIPAGQAACTSVM